jgi:hypothetical protein
LPTSPDLRWPENAQLSRALWRCLIWQRTSHNPEVAAWNPGACSSPHGSRGRGRTPVRLPVRGRAGGPGAAAQQASSFDWTLLSHPVTVHIGAVGVSHSAPGQVWLDGGLLNTGRFAWATVLDEFAHQVDYQLLHSPRRALLQARLGARAWCYELAGLAHSANGCERFASTFAWAYWPSKDNAYRPHSRADESAAMPAAAFRSLLAQLLAQPAPS